MFDEQGNWREETYNQPQSGLMGLLNVFNAFNSQNQAQKALAARSEAVKQSLFRDPNAQAYLNDPNAATATGQTPDQLQSSYSQTPGAQFRSWYGQNPNADFADVMAHGVMTGAEPFNAYAASALGQQKLEAAGGRNTATNFGRIVESARKAMATRSDPQEGAKLAEGIIRAGAAGLPGISDDQVDAAVSSVTGAARGMTVDPKVQAVINDKNAQADYRKMQTNLLPAETQAKIARWDSMVGLSDVEQQLKQIDLAYAQKGQISPALKAQIEARLEAAGARIQSAGPTLTDVISQGNSTDKSAMDARRNAALGTIKSAIAKLEGQPAPETANPAGGSLMSKSGRPMVADPSSPTGYSYADVK